MNPDRERLDISFVSQNCNSLNVATIKNQDLKISAIMNYKSDVVFLSDVRLNGKDHIITDKVRLGYNVYHNSSKNSRGVAVLISKQVEHEILETSVDPQENLILLRVKLNKTEMVIGSVYGPNLDPGCEIFYNNIKALIVLKNI